MRKVVLPRFSKISVNGGHVNLIDFLTFDAFNEMRTRMGTDTLGRFELFDPEVHLTGDERSVLERKGLQVSRGHLGRLLDHTLCYKNSRVVLVADHLMHITHCAKLPLEENLGIATSVRPFETKPRVCADCLQYLAYQGYDETKARKERYNADVLNRFSLTDFWKDYPPYPLNRERELVKPLD